MKIYKIAQSVDDQYLSFIKNKKFKEASQLVKQKAQSNGYTFGPVYHGTYGKFTQFDENYSGKTDAGYFGRGFYFTPSKSYASDFGKVMIFMLKIDNPLKLPSAGSMGHKSLLDARDILGKIMGKQDLITNRELPNGYSIRREPQNDWGVRNGRDVYSVYPNEELYGTDREIYGKEALTPEEAIVLFNDELKGKSINSGWLMGLTKDIGRDEMVQAIRSAGHDSVLIVDAEFEVGKVDEIVLWEPSKVKLIKTVTYDDSKQIIPLSKRFDVGNGDSRY